MHTLESVIIEGFWGTRVLDFEFYDDVNFFIGVNGSGKTTVVNLISSALTADFNTLEKIDFSQIKIKLKSKDSRKKPFIHIKKTFNKESPFPTIYFEFRESMSESPTIKYQSEVFDDVFARSYKRSILDRDRHNTVISAISSNLKAFVNVSWLSVHRYHADRRIREENGNESAVDKKLNELSDRLVRYFSTLGQQGALLLEGFQKTVFLSMLQRRSSKPIFSSARQMNVDEEKSALEAIFSSFNLKKTEYQSRIDSHFEIFAKAQEKLTGNANTGLNSTEISVLIGTERIDHIVEEWNSLVRKRLKIFEPRDTYLKIINGMMQRKTFFINEKNELEVKSQSGKEIQLSDLSSGEKQLLIVLGEALLQEKKNWIYIADEPELSLHVRWQEKLVDNLLSINPNAQIVFATHSPDVVSHYGRNIFDMESKLNELF
ncbi:AAA family ATPase [Citrobacter europaeus]|uniref:AAA family ATPase n=1 Tax=Citrobacter europaeus TaxID=1914243 RepID=UPI001BCD00BD|nr:AAA family ATPase [Citrobacter europaeus]